VVSFCQHSKTFNVSIPGWTFAERSQIQQPAMADASRQAASAAQTGGIVTPASPAVELSIAHLQARHAAPTAVTPDRVASAALTGEPVPMATFAKLGQVSARHLAAIQGLRGLRVVRRPLLSLPLRRNLHPWWYGNGITSQCHGKLSLASLPAASVHICVAED
jgi:hypothetical protein